MPSIFSRIVSGEIPCYRIAEDDKHLAFLDVFPLKRGHCLVIPKKETDYLFDLEAEEFKELMDFTYRVAKALKSSVPCKRVSVQVIGLEVPHAHVHLIPINSMNDCNFTNAKLQLTKEEFEMTAAEISAKFIA